MAGESKDAAPEEGPESTGPAPAAPAPSAGVPAAAPPPEESWETRFKYLYADFENFRRRVERERASAREQVRADLLRGLLPVYEAALRAREAVERLGPSDPVRRGIDLLVTEWQAFLDGARVAPVARTGGRFDSELHEAVAEAPVGPAHPEGSIVEIVQQGYRMGSALLRPAKVVVARPPSGAPKTASAAPPGEGSEE